MCYNFSSSPARNLFKVLSTSISSYISKHKSVFERSEVVTVKMNTLLQLNGQPDSEMISRFNAIRDSKRKLNNALVDCGIKINRITTGQYDLVFSKSTKLSNQFIKLWDEEEKNFRTVPKSATNISIDTPASSKTNNVVTPSDMFYIMQGNYSLGSKRSSTNSCKPFLKSSTKSQRSKVKKSIKVLKQLFPNDKAVDLKALAAAINDALNPTLRKKRKADELQNIDISNIGIEIPTKKMRRSWKPEEKQYVIDLMQLIPVHVEIKLKQRVLDRLGPVFKDLKWSHIGRWIQSAKIEKEKTGPKVNEEFEKAVWSRLLIAIKRQVFDVDSRKTIDEIKVLYNVTYSYEIIIEAATKEQKLEQWTNDEKIQALKFSSGWVHNFLLRVNFHRRRITREKHNCPAELFVQEAMAELQFESEEYESHQVANLDETALNWGLGPNYIYCACDTDRGEQAGLTDLKARITGVPTVLANGNFLPMFFIIKHSRSSADSPDQTTMQVVRNLHKLNGFTRVDGWELKIWEATLDSIVHRSWYLIHTQKGHVITSQYKAWNDAIRMAMMIKLVLKPYVDRNGGKMLLWMDNCSLHHVWWLQPMFDEAGIKCAYLPPNMTWILQVLDLVVNGPMKAHIRKLRAGRILEYFENYKELFDSQSLLPEADRVVPKWNVPKPEYKECILDIIGLLETKFQHVDFQKSIQKTFIKTGCYHRDDKSFVQFKYSNNLGTLLFEPKGTLPEFPKDENHLSNEEMLVYLEDQINLEDE